MSYGSIFCSDRSKPDHRWRECVICQRDLKADELVRRSGTKEAVLYPILALIAMVFVAWYLTGAPYVRHPVPDDPSETHAP